MPPRTTSTTWKTRRALCHGKAEAKAQAENSPHQKRLAVSTRQRNHAEKIDWLWPDRLARGKLNFIAGPPDQGKSQITCDLSARVSNGTEWPNHEGKIDEPGSVIILAAEDDAADTILPRLVAAGADLTKIFILQMMVRPLANKASAFSTSRRISHC